MMIRSMLVCVSGGAAGEGAIEVGCQLARRFDAHLEGFHVKADPRDLFTYAGGGWGTPLSGDWIEQLQEQATAIATKAQEAFTAASIRHGLPLVEAPRLSGPSAAWREEIGYAPSSVSSRARFFDLVVLGRSERVVHQPHTDTVEETLVQSGRPVLLAPTRPLAKLGEAVAFGWNGSTAAVRVLSAALPILAAAQTTFVITVGDRHRESAGSVVEYLGWHGIAAVHRPVSQPEGVGSGEQLLATARDEGADLIVMGGYGHTPWREAIFGGATREVIGTSRLPVLLSH